MGMARGEEIIKESGTFPVAYAKSTFRTINGRLTLTNMSLVFTGGRFQSPVGALLGGGKEQIQIPLNSITRVDKGLGASMTIFAGKNYTFKGMRGTNEWIAAIEQARRQMAQPGTAQASPPTPMQSSQLSAGGFCPNCGNPVGVGDRFCKKCGHKL